METIYKTKPKEPMNLFDAVGQPSILAISSVESKSLRNENRNQNHLLCFGGNKQTQISDFSGIMYKFEPSK